jgi:glycosyltransferase involved in cell wall biosynthesis
MRVVFIITDLTTGGAQENLYRLLSRLDRHRFQLEVISLMGIGTLGQAILDLGIPVHTLELPAGAVSPVALNKLRVLMRRIRPEVIQGWMYHGNLAATAGWLALFGRPQLFWGVRQSVSRLSDERVSSRWIILAGALLSRLAHGVVYNAHISRDQHCQFGYSRQNAVIIPNGFDWIRFTPRPDRHLEMRAALDIQENQLVIGHVARFHPMKDHPTLLKAIAPLILKHENLVAVLSGKRVDVSNRPLVELLNELGIAQRVRLLGERSDVAELMSIFDVFCSSSACNEGFPTVVGEAMASGVPCVVTDVGDSARAVGDTGYVVPPGDPKALSQEIARILALPAEMRRELGHQARARIVEHYSLSQAADRYQGLYENALSNPGITQ